MDREECDYCIKHKTMYCPNSSECYSLDNLPNFKTKLDILKEIDTLNKGIDELIKKYEDYTNNIFTNMSILNEMTEQNFQKYDKDIVRVWAKYSVYTDFIQDLKKLKGE